MVGECIRVPLQIWRAVPGPRPFSCERCSENKARQCHDIRIYQVSTRVTNHLQTEWDDPPSRDITQCMVIHGIKYIAGLGSAKRFPHRYWGFMGIRFFPAMMGLSQDKWIPKMFRLRWKMMISYVFFGWHFRQTPYASAICWFVFWHILVDIQGLVSVAF